MMAAVAVLALALAVIVQAFRLHQALVGEERLRAEAVLQRARAERAESARMLVAAQAEGQRQAPPATPRP
jgi:hypothetical protein